MDAQNQFPIIDIIGEINTTHGRNKYDRSPINAAILLVCIGEIMNCYGYCLNDELTTLIQQFEDDFLVCMFGLFGCCDPSVCIACLKIQTTFTQIPWKLWCEQAKPKKIQVQVTNRTRNQEPRNQKPRNQEPQKKVLMNSKNTPRERQVIEYIPDYPSTAVPFTVRSESDFYSKNWQPSNLEQHWNEINPNAMMAFMPENSESDFYSKNPNAMEAFMPGICGHKHSKHQNPDAMETFVPEMCSSEHKHSTTTKCKFGMGCFRRNNGCPHLHPDEIRCRFGANCFEYNCEYAHPLSLPETQPLTTRSKLPTSTRRKNIIIDDDNSSEEEDLRTNGSTRSVVQKSRQPRCKEDNEKSTKKEKRITVLKNKKEDFQMQRKTSNSAAKKKIAESDENTNK